MVVIERVGADPPLPAFFRAVACHQPHMSSSDGLDGQLNASGDLELQQEGSDVEVRGSGADTQACADLVVGETLDDKRQHGSLLAGKRFDLLCSPRQISPC